MAQEDEILRKKRTSFFYACSILYMVLNLTLAILIPITIAQAILLTITNKSNFPEVANVFQKIDFFLQGNCISFIGGGQVCRKLSPLEMFYKFPDFSQIPTRVQPGDLPALFQTIPGQNPIVYIILIVLELLAFASLYAGYNAYRKTAKKSIIKVAVMSFIMVILAAASLGVSESIYKDILPKALNKPITVSVMKDGGLLDVTGRPSDMGIKFENGSGMINVIFILVAAVVNFLTSLRWIFEGVVPTKIREHIRINY